MSGAFGITDARSLLSKLDRELSRMNAVPLNDDHAWNFFVTAEHMLDARYPDDPGDVNKSRQAAAQRTAARARDVFRRIAGGIATLAKHLEVVNQNLKWPGMSSGIAVLPPLSGISSPAPNVAPQRFLAIVLDDQIAAAVQSSGVHVHDFNGKLVVAARDVAQRVLDDWTAELRAP